MWPARYVGQLGYLAHLTSGMIYVRDNWLAPTVGRWLRRDRVIRAPNLYRYVGSNPVNEADPSGQRQPGASGVGVVVTGALGYKVARGVTADRVAWVTDYVSTETSKIRSSKYRLWGSVPLPSFPGICCLPITAEVTREKRSGWVHAVTMMRGVGRWDEWHFCEGGHQLPKVPTYRGVCVHIGGHEIGHHLGQEDECVEDTGGLKPGYHDPDSIMYDPFHEAARTHPRHYEKTRDRFNRCYTVNWQLRKM